MKPLVALLLFLFIISTARCQQSVKNGTLSAELNPQDASVSKRAADYVYGGDYADENDEYSDTVHGNELVYDDEEKDGEGEVYSRSAPQDYDDYEEDDGDYNDQNDEDDTDFGDDKEDDVGETDDSIFKRSSHYDDIDDNEDDYDDDEDENYDEEMEKGLIDSIEDGESNEGDDDQPDDEEDDGENDGENDDDDQPDDEEDVDYEEDGEKEEGAMYRRSIKDLSDYKDDDDDYEDVEEEDKREEEERIMDSRSKAEDDYDEDGYNNIDDYEDNDGEDDNEDDNDDDGDEVDYEDDDEEDEDYDNGEKEFGRVQKRLTPTKSRELIKKIASLDKTIGEIRSKQYYNTLPCLLEKANKMEKERDHLVKDLGMEPPRKQRIYPDKSPQQMSTSELHSKIFYLESKMMKIGRVSYYHWNSYRCQRELRESIMQYVKKYWTELWTRNRSRREPGDDGRVGPDISWQDRQEREAPAEPEEESRDKRDCDESDTPSISQLAAQTVQIEREIQRKIANKLEEKINQGVSENSEEGVLQTTLDTAIDEDIGDKVQEKLKLQIGSLPNKVRQLEKKYQKLKQELENSPWSRFQRVMMNHLKENSDLGNSLTQEELEKLEEMHKMAEPDRKEFMNALRKKIKPSSDEDEEDDDKKKVVKVEAPKRKLKAKPREKGKKTKQQPKKKISRNRKKTVGKKKKAQSKSVARRRKGKKKVAKGQPKKKKSRKGKANRKQRKYGLKKKRGKDKSIKISDKKEQLLKVLKDAKVLPSDGHKKPQKTTKVQKKDRKLKKKGKKGKKKSRKQRKKPRKNRLWKVEKKKNRNGKRGNAKKRPGPKKRKNKKTGGQAKQQKKLTKKGQGKERKREKRDLEGSRGEWEVSATAVSHNNDPLHEQKNGGRSTSIKYQLSPKAKSVGVWRSAVVKETQRDTHPLEWTGDYYQHSSQPGLRNRRSTASVDDGGSVTDRTGDETLKKTEGCDKCETKVGEEVCGSNGKTYNSLCHALQCGKLRQMDVTFGPCQNRDPCSHNHCSSNEICAAMTYGPCLTVYTNGGRRLPCRQYICVAKEDCGHTEYSEVCGVDGNTYPTLCHLQQRGVKLAYSGHCREALCSGPVCGRNGVTYPSSCYARAHNVRVDYRGTCFAENNEKDGVNSCNDVRQTGMCGVTECPDAFIPEGACCPVCGGGVEVRPEAGQLAELARDWPEINHLYMVENFLRRLVPREMQGQCELSLTLTDSGAIMMVLEAVDTRQSAVCQAAAMDVTEKINRPSPSDDSLRPLAREARILGDIVQDSVRAQSDIITSDVTQAKASTTNNMINSYNNRVKSIESTANEYEGENSGCAEVSATLATLSAASLALLLVI